MDICLWTFFMWTFLFWWFILMTEIFWFFVKKLFRCPDICNGSRNKILRNIGKRQYRRGGYVHRNHASSTTPKTGATSTGRRLRLGRKNHAKSAGQKEKMLLKNSHFKQKENFILFFAFKHFFCLHFKFYIFQILKHFKKYIYIDWHSAIVINFYGHTAVRFKPEFGLSFLA